MVAIWHNAVVQRNWFLVIVRIQLLKESASAAKLSMRLNGMIRGLSLMTGNRETTICWTESRDSLSFNRCSRLSSLVNARS
jgi:hypothetical protein